MPLVVIDVLFIERPADTLRHTALDLALDVAGVDRPAYILNRSVAEDRNLAGLRVNLNIHNVGGKAWTGAASIERDTRRDRIIGLRQFLGRLFERHPVAVG